MKGAGALCLCLVLAGVLSKPLPGLESGEWCFSSFLPGENAFRQSFFSASQTTSAVLALKIHELQVVEFIKIMSTWK